MSVNRVPDTPVFTAPSRFRGKRAMTSKRTALTFALWAAVILGRAQGQQYVISTYAGGPPPPRANMTLSVRSVATDAAGNVYFSSSYYPPLGSTDSCVCVFKLD